MADNPITVEDGNGYKINGAVPGDTYTFRLRGGTYELVVRATSYGAGDGVTVSRVMPDGTTLVEYADVTADGAPEVFQAGHGTYRLAVAADVDPDVQLVISRIY